MAVPCRIAVTSKNQTKIDAVLAAFSEKLPGLTTSPSVDIVACPSDSGIPHGQPWGLQHTYEGALARLHNLKTCFSTDGFAYLVSCENGVCGLLRHDQTLALDIACVVVEDTETGLQGMNFSQARPYPLSKVQELKRAGTSNEDIGCFCNQWYSERALSLSRADQVRTATGLALEMLLTTSGAA